MTKNGIKDKGNQFPNDISGDGEADNSKDTTKEDLADDEENKDGFAGHNLTKKHQKKRVMHFQIILLMMVRQTNQ